MLTGVCVRQAFHPATVYPKPNVNARGRLSFTRLCWSHTAFPCIIYVKLSPPPPLLYAFPSTGHEQVRINEWQEIKYLCREHLRRVTWLLEGGWGGREGCAEQLPAACPPEKSRVREGSICCWGNAAGNGWVLTVFAPVRLPCWFSACCFVCVQTKTSSSYSANHRTNNAYSYELYELHVVYKYLSSL